MTKQQEQDRLDRIDAIGKLIRGLMEEFSWESDKTNAHLERALAHIDESWIDADGQRARTVGELVTDIENMEELFAAVAKAEPGTKFQIGTKTFTKQAEVIS